MNALHHTACLSSAHYAGHGGTCGRNPGFVTCRASSSDQIFASVVSVLLALMDGLKDRGQVLVIGATNR
jgi:hypothetical protein